MTMRTLARLTIAGLVVWLAGCDGSSGTPGTTGAGGSAGSGGGGTGTGGAAGAGKDAAAPEGDGAAGSGGASGTLDAGTGDGPPMVMGARRIVPGRARMVGGAVSSCSQPSGNAPRWCAFTLPGTVPLGSTALWVIDLAKAMASDVPCDGTSPSCLKLTGTLWTGAPRSGGPIHPIAHHFDGETLIYYVGTTVSDQSFSGPIYAWRPGWTEGKPLSGPNGYSCSGHGTADVALCIENVQLTTPPVHFDITAGRVNGTKLPLASRIYPSSPTNAKQWLAAFTPSGDHFAYSTGGPTAMEPETLYLWKIDEVGMMARRQTIGTNLAEWDFSPDGKYWYYLRDYNYPPRDKPVEPSGTLVRADFPGGGNPVTLGTRVGSYRSLAEGNADRGVAFLDGLTMGRGNYKILRDTSRPATVVTVATGVLSASVSPDLRYSLLQTQWDAMNETGDAIVIKNDGTGRCTLVGTPTSDQYGADFLPGSGRVFWADRLDPNTGAAEGWMANPDGCGDKQKFGDLVDFWFLSGDQGILYSDGATAAGTSTLRFAKLGAGGMFPATTTVIAAAVGRIYAPVGKDRDTVVFQVSGPAEGLYAYGPIPYR